MSETTEPLFREHRIWRRPGVERALRYVLFEDLSTGRFAVQSCDVFPTTADNVAWLESSIGELMADEDPGERSGWHASIAEAIDAFDKAFAEDLEDDEIEDDEVEDDEVEDDEIEDAEDDAFDDDEFDGDDEFHEDEDKG